VYVPTVLPCGRSDRRPTEHGLRRPTWKTKTLSEHRLLSHDSQGSRTYRAGIVTQRANVASAKRPERELGQSENAPKGSRTRAIASLSGWSRSSSAILRRVLGCCSIEWACLFFKRGLSLRQWDWAEELNGGLMRNLRMYLALYVASTKAHGHAARPQCGLLEESLAIVGRDCLRNRLFCG